MKKRIMALLLATAMLVSATACGSSSSSDSSTDSSEETVEEETEEETQEETDVETEEEAEAETEEETDVEEDTENESGRPTDGNGKIGFSTMTLGSEFFSNLDDAVHERLEAAGYEVVTVSCEMNAATQVSDIENLITMDCEAIFFFAVDTDSLIDVLKKGREAGIKMYGVACTIDDTDAYDKIINTDQYASGVAEAEMAAAWIEETFPDAEDGSIEVALIVNTATTDSVKRSTGMETIADICSKVTIVEEYDLSGASDANIKSQEYAEMMQSQYPDLKVILNYGCDGALGTNEVYMRDASLDIDNFAIFSVDTSDAIYELIVSAEEGESVVRGTVSLGEDLSLDVWECLIDADLEYMDENKCIYKPVDKIDITNVYDYYEG